MKEYSVEDRVNMIFILGECSQNCFLASRVYAERFPLKDHPRKEVFERLLTRFRETGSVAYKKRKLMKPITEAENVQLDVLQSVIENPNTSHRIIARELDISKASVGRILKSHNYHPYHIQMHQNLYGTDFEQRLQFCLWFLEKSGTDENFFDKILFTDESTFHNNGLMNRHNFHYYSTENKHEFRLSDRQTRWSLNVYGGLMGEHVVGPYFFNSHLNGRKFLRFLKRDFWILLEDIPLNDRRNMWLQLDGAPAHFSLNVRSYLNRKFPEKWVGRSGPSIWPPRSPDLTSMDFFLWGYVKNLVYQTPPTTEEDMKIRICNAFASVTRDMLRNVKNNFENRLRMCIEQNGHHFEPFF